jgi:exonuclease VII small subunit
MQADLSIEVVKVVLLLLMVAVAGSAIYLASALDVLIRPVSRQLLELHKGHSGALEPRLLYIKQRYISLLSHVDNIDTAEFSSGEIERLSLRLLGREVTAASAHGWIHQSPGILISFGLLGTFWGLTVGLAQISGALAPGATPQQTMVALSAIVAPMGTAFQTSLIGLVLSLIVLITSQLSGSRTCLERCESLLSSWLETVLPQELGDKVMTPLRQSIDELNQTSRKLPAELSKSVESAMQAAFAAKLESMFNANSSIVVEAQRATRQLSAVSSTLNECGQDFVAAATAFRQSNFPAALKDSVAGLLESKERLAVTSDTLSGRLQELRDSLSASQDQWQLLAKSAETELQSCRQAVQQIQQGLTHMEQSSKALEEGVQISAVAAKQLRETRLEVMRDRKLAIDVAESVRDRLATDSTSVETCRVFAAALESALSKWNAEVQQLDALRSQFIQSAIDGRVDDKAEMVILKRKTDELIQSVQLSIETDIRGSIANQRLALDQLHEPMTVAQRLASELVQQLEDLKSSTRGTSGGLS